MVNWHKLQAGQWRIRFIRRALYLPALSAIKPNEQFKNLFIRFVLKHGIKMKGGLAAQRKLIGLIFVKKVNCVLNKKHKKSKKEIEIEAI
jgi:transposase